MKLKAFAAVGFVLVLTATAGADHPGSHAVRKKDGRVRLDVVATGSDACTSIASILNVAPPGVTPPPDSAPVTVQLERPEEAFCATVITTLRSRKFLEIPKETQQLHLYVLASDGALLSTERVRVQ